MESDQVVAAPQAAPAPKPRRGGVLANSDFVKLWAGQTVSLMGTQITLFTMPLVAVLTLNATALQVGILNALRFVPVIALSVFAGVWLDRRKRRPVLVTCAVSSSLLIGLVPLASTFGWLSIGLLYVVTALVGTLNMVFDVGALSYVPFLVTREHLADGNSKLQASLAVAGISGPGLAGLLVGLITAPITLSADAVSYLFSACGLLSIRTPEPEPDTSVPHGSVLSSIAEGFRAVFGTRLLWTLLTQTTLLNLFFGSYTTIFVVYAIRYLHLTPLKLGIALAAGPLGGLFGALLAGRVRNALGLGKVMTLTTIGVSTFLLFLLVPHGASPVTVAILGAAQLAYGFSISMFNVNAITLRQTLTPPRLLGRMNATYRMMLFGAQPPGALLGGILAAVLGLRPALIIALVAMVSPMAWLFFAPVFRLTELPKGPDPEPVLTTAGTDGTDD
jgi:MFS family permease